MKTISKTQAAINLVDKHSFTPYAAAKAIGVSASAVYRAMARGRFKRCPTCGAILKNQE